MNAFDVFYDRLSLAVADGSDSGLSMLEADVWPLCSVVSAVIIHCNQLFSQLTSFRKRCELASAIIAFFSSEAALSRQTKFSLLLLPLFEHLLTLPAGHSSAAQTVEALSTLHECCCEEGFYCAEGCSVGRYVATNLNQWLVRASDRFTISPSSALTQRMKKDLLIKLGKKSIKLRTLLPSELAILKVNNLNLIYARANIQPSLPIPNGPIVGGT
jgi:hypothetical protein